MTPNNNLTVEIKSIPLVLSVMIYNSRIYQLTCVRMDMTLVLINDNLLHVHICKLSCRHPKAIYFF